MDDQCIINTERTIDDFDGSNWQSCDCVGSSPEPLYPKTTNSWASIIFLILAFDTKPDTVGSMEVCPLPAMPENIFDKLPYHNLPPSWKRCLISCCTSSMGTKALRSCNFVILSRSIGLDVPAAILWCKPECPCGAIPRMHQQPFDTGRHFSGSVLASFDTFSVLFSATTNSVW